MRGVVSTITTIWRDTGLHSIVDPKQQCLPAKGGRWLYADTCDHGAWKWSSTWKSDLAIKLIFLMPLERES